MRVAAGPGDAVMPQLQTDLWILLGIATGSPLISSLILSAKAGGGTAEPAPPAEDGQAGGTAPAHVDPTAVSVKGVLDVRSRPGASSFLDLFVGEEVTNRASVDMSRVQQFVFTLVSVLAYVALLATAFSTIPPYKPLAALPSLSLYLVGLLAISHAGYLTAKALPKGQ